MKYSYTPQGVCSRKINVEIEDGIVKKVEFVGGCNGNTQGVAALIEGMSALDAVRRLKGIQCGSKGTSCPDQLAIALQQALASAE